MEIKGRSRDELCKMLEAGGLEKETAEYLIGYHEIISKLIHPITVGTKSILDLGRSFKGKDIKAYHLSEECQSLLKMGYHLSLIHI